MIIFRDKWHLKNEDSIGQAVRHVLVSQHRVIEYDILPYKYLAITHQHDGASDGTR